MKDRAICIEKKGVAVALTARTYSKGILYEARVQGYIKSNLFLTIAFKKPDEFMNEIVFMKDKDAADILIELFAIFKKLLLEEIPPLVGDVFNKGWRFQITERSFSDHVGERIAIVYEINFQRIALPNIGN